MQETVDLIQTQMANLRSLCNELRPPTLIHFGIQKALKAHIETVQEKQPGLRIFVCLEDEVYPLPEDVRLALFRICQEALNNIIKHAEATQVFVELRQSEQQVELEIRDNGRGFAVPENWIDLAREGHLGLVGIVERTESVSGSIDMRSEPEQGTFLLVTIPLENMPVS